MYVRLEEGGGVEGFGWICVAPVCKFWTLFQKCFALKMIARSQCNLALQIRNFLTGRCLLSFATARTFCAFCDGLQIQRYFSAVCDCAGKDLLASIIEILKRKLGKLKQGIFQR